MSTTSYSSDLSPQELHAQLRGEEPLHVIDVREYPEYAAARIEGARLIPSGEIATRAHELDHNERVVLVCRSGRRSTMALEKLRARVQQRGSAPGGNGCVAEREPSSHS